MKAALLLLVLGIWTSVAAQYHSNAIVAQEGDTIAKLAARFGIDPIALAAFNGRLPNSTLALGQPMNVPNGAVLKRICDMRMAPEIRGLKLGMEMQDVHALMTEKALEIARMMGDFSTLHNASIYHFRDHDRFKGIRSVGFNFYEKKLSELRVSYEPEIKWASDYEFVLAVGRNLQLPSYAWQIQRGDFVMPCDGFRIEIARDTVTLRDAIAEKAEADAVKLAEEAKKKTFKP